MNDSPRPPLGYALTHRRWPRQDLGFTLIEVLITAVVTMIAITGLATVQLLAVRAAGSSQQRSQATAMAYEIVDRLRLNRGASGLTDTALGGGYDGITLCNAGSRQADDTRGCIVGALSSLIGNDMVKVDLRTWWSTLDGSGLPHWFAGLVRSGGIFTVAVQWDDARAEDHDDSGSQTRASCLGSLMPTAMQEVCVVTQL